MPENPLLPNAELRAMLALTKRCATLDAAARRRSARSARSRLPILRSREALLSATLQQLKPGDLLLPEPGDNIPDQLLAELGAKSPTVSSTASPAVPDLGHNTPRILLAAAMAAALRQAGTEAIVLAHLRERASEPDWTAALAWAQEKQLPLVLACADPRGEAAFQPDPRAPKDAFSWKPVRQVAQRLKLPILTVDGEDAVAVYRAMQESVLRARSGAGPALLWAMLPNPKSTTTRTSSSDPLRRLQRYLRSRKIPF